MELITYKNLLCKLCKKPARPEDMLAHLLSHEPLEFYDMQITLDWPKKTPVPPPEPQVPPPEPHIAPVPRQPVTSPEMERRRRLAATRAAAIGPVPPRIPGFKKQVEEELPEEYAEEEEGEDQGGIEVGE